MKKILSLIGMSVILSGCAANGFYEGVASGTPDNVSKETQKNFIGVPLLLSMEGSSAKLDNEWRVTAAHNKFILAGKEVYYHPQCDFAVYREKSEGDLPSLGYVYEKETIYHAGYPVGMLFSSHEGQYIGEVRETRDNCIYSASDATVISGMSGGGVYNDAGQLVGVNIGIMFGTIEWETGQEEFSPSVFMSINAMKGFIEESIGKKIELTEKNKEEIALK